ncbi:MAG: aminotransferase class I/II-fold pyridoxal phosphate-dependent enzyme [Hyphomicrobiaceae bacterium]
MTGKRDLSLEDYAHRRWVLSGLEPLTERFPYNTSTELIGAGSHGPLKASFAHYDYLGLADEPSIQAAAVDAARTIGVGSGASRLVGGEYNIHRQLERELAAFLGVEDTLAMVSGYGTNVALIGHLLMKGDLLLVDEASHNSIMTGARLSRAQTLEFRHNDLDHCAQLLAQHRESFKRVLIVVEGLYSMDGDVPDLPRLCALCRRHGAWLMVDEAHSIGVLGNRGRGLSEHFGLAAAEVDLIVGTLSKALVSCGGFIAGKQRIIQWLRHALPGFVYSVGLPPPSAAAALQALRLLQDEPWRVERLRERSSYFFGRACASGLEVGTAVGHAVIPLLMPDVPTALTAGRVALDAGYFVPPIAQIAVPKDAPRLRCFLTAKHTHEQIDGLIEALAPFAGLRRDEAPVSSSGTS